jgi:MraZ protein
VTTGEFRASLDEKGRILIPSKIRSEIGGNSLVLTQSVDRCLWLFTPEEWSRISTNLMDSTSLFQSRARMLRRRIIAPAQPVDIDKSGRINISVSLREYAGLKKECIIVGIESYVELWDETEYRDYWTENEPSFQEAAEELGKIISI